MEGEYRECISFEAPGLSGLFLRFTVMSILINLKKIAPFLGECHSLVLIV